MSEKLEEKAKKKLSKKLNAWRMEDAENAILIAEANMQVAKSGENKIARSIAAIWLKIEQAIANLQKSDVKYFRNSVQCSFEELGLSKEECKKLLPELISETGLKLEIVWQCTCAWNDDHHDPTCGNVLQISW